MRAPLVEKIKQALRPLMFQVFLRQRPVFQCPICQYQGPFKHKRVTTRSNTRRLHSKCPGCGGVERHRMLSLLINDVLGTRDPNTGSVLHFAPEACLATPLKALFKDYATADLFMPGVDHKEDIQAMSFADGMFDCVLISHVMTSVPKMDVSIRELRRILAPGGIAIIAEAFACEKTNEFGEQRGDFWREVGQDALDLFASHFETVEPYVSDRYDARYQLNNCMEVDGRSHDSYPELIRVENVGYREMVAICHV